MRILYLVHQYLPECVGGTELYTRWLTEALHQQGHETFIFYRRSAPGVGLERRTEAGVQIWAAWSGLMNPTHRFKATFGEPPMVRAFEQVLDEARPDLVHIQHLMGYPAALVGAIRRRKIPYVITLHDFWWICANAQLLTNYSQEVCPGPRAYLNCARCAVARAGQPHLWPALPPLAGLLAWRNHVLRQVMRAADRLIAPTEFVRDWYAGQGVPTERLITIPHGLEMPGPQPRRRRESGAGFRFAYIGGLSWQKGVHNLVRAFGDINSGAELWLAGDETAEPDYVARLRAQATPQVRFLGKLTRSEVWQTLAQVDVVVVPSLWYETFSFIVSEAFAAGVPVIASRLGPLPERVRDGQDGLLVRPGDWRALKQALSQFVQDTTLLPRLRTGIRPVSTMADHVREIEGIYLAAS